MFERCAQTHEMNCDRLPISTFSVSRMLSGAGVNEPLNGGDVLCTSQRVLPVLKGAIKFPAPGAGVDVRVRRSGFVQNSCAATKAPERPHGQILEERLETAVSVLALLSF
jgi:hypothetical protein